MSNKFSRAPISFLICACFLLLLRVILLFFTLTPLFASDLQIPRFTSQQVKDRQHVGFVKDLCRRLNHNSAAATKQSKSELKFIWSIIYTRLLWTKLLMFFDWRSFNNRTWLLLSLTSRIDSHRLVFLPLMLLPGISLLCVQRCWTCCSDLHQTADSSGHIRTASCREWGEKQPQKSWGWNEGWLFHLCSMKIWFPFSTLKY